MNYFRSVLTLSPLKITLGYCLFGFIWIPATDVVLAVRFESQGMPTFASLVKGWTFICLSGAVIYGLSRLRHRQMEATRTKLETTNQQLQVLHRVFRHNIRNDVNVIKGYTSLASDRICEPEVISQLETIEETADQINSISERLKIVKQVDPTVSDDRDVDVVDLVNSEVERVETAYPDVAISLATPDEAWVEGSATLRYAIRETLENAIAHFDRPLAECVLSIEVSRTTGAVRLEIRDNGPGVPDDELEVVTACEETPLVHGSSVGLWLITWLCRLHDGDVEFSVHADRGTTVAFELPAARRVPVIETRSSPIDSIPSVGRS